ncbi:alpha/beta fold hydrolase [Pseudogemmobacter bohemicus]|uniref:alpha/beta fold hydrolase n=1 Tax=Pseudogemmobacter bohemicus TaxID=2250708 RepID=UPI000DD41F6F|nr:alpha/beta fold hydrolase [Pseudogemmobacter bohemicus]
MRLVLVPGLLNDAALWHDQLAPLAAVCEPVVADITQGETLEELARAVLTAGGPRFALAGFSLGGIVAQEVMRRAPERVSHLALIDTTMLPDGADRAAERRCLMALAADPGTFHGFGEKLLARYLAPENLGNAAIAARIREMTRRLGPGVFIRQSLIQRPDSRDLLPRITVPSLVLCGAHDQITPPEISREMARLIPGARIAIANHAGHMLPLEAPLLVSEALKRLILR